MGFAGKGSDQHQQGGAGQVKIGEHGIHGPEMMAGQDEEVGFAGEGGGGLPAAGQVRGRGVAGRQAESDLGCGLQRPHAGGAGGDDAPAPQPRVVDRAGGFGAEVHPFAVDGVATGIRGFDRLEGVEADVQGDISEADALIAQGQQQIGGEVQAGRGRRGRAVVAAEHGLIAFRVGQGGVDVGGQGHMPQVIESIVDGRVEVDEAAWPIQRGGNRRPDLPAVVFCDQQAFARGQFFAPRQRFPLAILAAAQQEQLGLAAAFFVADQPGVQHAGVVEHQQIAGAQKFWQIVDVAVRQGAAVAFQHQHAGMVARLDRRLSDHAWRQFVSEVRD